MSRFFASFARATAGFFGLCIAAVASVIAFYFWRGAHWINLESTYSERQLYESNPPNSLWIDLAAGFPLYIPALFSAGIAIVIFASFIRGAITRGKEQQNKKANKSEMATPRKPSD